ncbi:MAG: hypothetical protein O7J95_19415, partial [Planctomycetota bacterium]|nr:hypothetical protein [Planctomycetota bacterium]
MRTHRLLRLLQLGRLVPLAVERLWFFRFFRNTLGGRAALALALPLSLHLALYLALIAIPPRLDAVEAPGDLVRLREIYVPHEEFLRRSRQDPSGIIMSLREYRGLVLKALGRGEAGEAALPPLDAVVSRAEHEGVLRGHSVRLRSRLEVRVAREGWVACDLGLSIARPGEVTVDGAPGWIVQRPAAQPAPQGAHPPKGAAPTRDFLLLRGTGVHQVEILHTLRAVESRDVWTLSGRLPASVTAHVIVVVPGHAEGSSDPPFLEARFLEPSGSQRAGSTRFDVALGGRQDFSVTWRPRRALGMTDTLLAAEHRLTLLPRRSDPVAIWEVTVNVNRQETDQLALEEPAGVSIVRISGPHVHHWTQEGKTLHVVLNEARRGAIPLRLEGFLEPSGEPPAATEPQRFSVGGPRLLGAVSNVGSLAILDPAPERLEVDEVEGLREIALGEAPLPAVEGASGSAARLFSFPSPDVRIAFRTVPRPEEFEVRAACLLKVLDSTVSLEGVYRVDVQNGRVYRLELALPDPWRFRDVSVLRVAGQVAPAVRFEEVESDGSRRLEIGLSRALQAGSSIEFRLRVRHGGFDPQLGWEERQLEFRVPHFAAASRSHVDLGLSLAPSIDAERVDEGSWKVLGREALQGVGLEDPHLVAGLTTGSPTEAVTLDLRHRSPRGEFESVTHLLALERRLRVRTDLRVAVVDRAVDELRLVLPVPVSVTPHFITPGLKETSATADGDERSIHVVRFTRPWLGTRQLRVEYEVEDHSPGESVPLPTVDLQGDFIGQAVVALQSLGPVELVVTRGAALEPIDLDELPDFGAPWKEGRSLFAFRVRERGDPGSFTTRVHPRAPVVASFAREVEITTVLDKSGVSRTLVETLLAYSDRQNLEVKLPEDARPLEVVVGGEVVRSVRRSAAGRWSIPLPPVSYASISLLYERPYGSGEAPGAWGTWSESGPIFTGVPVGTTRWKLYHPPGYRFFLDGGNLQADEPLHEARPGHFARSIVWTLARGRLPLLTAFAPGGEGRRLHAPPGDAKASPLHLVSFKPEGFLVAASKIGGEPRMVLSYHSLAWRRFAAPSVFVLTLVAGLALALGLDRRKFYSLVVWGLVYATLGSAVFEWLLDWQSPFLLLPLSEGLSSVLLASLVIDGARLASRRFRGATASCLVAGALVASSASALAEEPAKEPAKEPETMPAAADEVLVPYDPEDVTSLDEAHAKVYLPYEKFRALWRRAHPGEPVAGEEPEWDLIVGNVAYRLSVDGDTYRLSGRAAVQVMVERWLELPLPFENVQLSTVRLDGVEVGVSQKDDRPFVALRGQGAHTVDVELTGQVIRQQGVYRLLGDLLSGSATRIEVELPTGAEPLLTATGEFALEKRGEVSVVTADLGRTGRLDLRWHFPGTEGQRASQVESTSLSLLELTVDGYRVSRTERLRVSGEPVSSVEYRIDGDWRIARVAAPELSEWSVVEVEGTRRLHVFFYRDVREAQLDVEGWSPLGDGEGPVASLSLLGAARQESYFGLRHGARRRWTPDSLAGTRRTSVPELPPGLAIDPRERPDRLHHIYGSGQAERLAATALEGNVQLTTRSVLVVDPRRLLISSRSRYRVSGPGPFRQQITIPGSWSVLAARGDVLRDWETSEEGGNTIITFHLKRRARSSDELLWSAERQLDELPDPLALPALEISTTDQGLRSEVHHWAVAAHESLELSATGENGLTSLRPTGDVVWLQLPPRRRYRFAYRSTGLEPSYSLAIRASTPESQLRATVVTFARPAEERLHVNTRLVFRTLRAGRDRV